MTGISLFMLVFLSTIESAYESLSEVSLRLMASEHEGTSRARFFRELLEHRRRFELMLILGTQLSIAAIAVMLAGWLAGLVAHGAISIILIIVSLVIIVFRLFVPRLISQNNPEAMLWFLLPLFRIFYRIFSVFVAPISALLDKMRKPEPVQAQTEEEESEETME
ncbi:MAG TPA: CNNM domain-containing protein, partial [Blastocatellia bacterium]|nr:CNNM domain-containing protein [Blastocatellia bacterium]